MTLRKLSQTLSHTSFEVHQFAPNQLRSPRQHEKSFAEAHPMPWVGVEETDGRPVLIAGLLGLAGGAVVWWYFNFWDAFFAYLGIVFAILLSLHFWRQICLPWGARRGARLVLAWFRERFPDEQVKGVAVRAIEPNRYIIAIYHGFGFPTPRTYFAIARPQLAEITELSDSEWRPRGLK